MHDDLLIFHALVWPDADQEMLADAAILIRDGRIVRVGHFHAHADLMIDADGCLAMPGLIQGHVHLAQTLFRGLAEDLPLPSGLTRRRITVASAPVRRGSGRVSRKEKIAT